MLEPLYHEHLHTRFERICQCINLPYPTTYYFLNKHCPAMKVFIFCSKLSQRHQNLLKMNLSNEEIEGMGHAPSLQVKPKGQLCQMLFTWLLSQYILQGDNEETKKNLYSNEPSTHTVFISICLPVIWYCSFNIIILIPIRISTNTRTYYLLLFCFVFRKIDTQIIHAPITKIPIIIAILEKIPF